MPKFWAYMFW